VSGTQPYERVRFFDDALVDIRAISKRSRPVAVEVLRLLKLLDQGQIAATPLQNFGKTGDLTDCGKVVVLVEGEPEHRIVVRDVADGSVELVEVVVVEDRSRDLPYLLAGLRLDRIADPIRRADASRDVYRIRKQLEPE